MRCEYLELVFVSGHVLCGCEISTKVNVYENIDDFVQFAHLKLNRPVGLSS